MRPSVDSSLIAGSAATCSRKLACCFPKLGEPANRGVQDEGRGGAAVEWISNGECMEVALEWSSLGAPPKVRKAGVDRPAPRRGPVVFRAGGARSAEVWAGRRASRPRRSRRSASPVIREGRHPPGRLPHQAAPRLDRRGSSGRQGQASVRPRPMPWTLVPRHNKRCGEVGDRIVAEPSSPSFRRPTRL